MLLMRKRICIVLTLMLVFCCFGCTDTGSWQSAYSTGNKYLDAGMYQQAGSAFSKAIALDNKKADAYAGLAQAKMCLQDYDAARQVLIDAMRAGVDDTAPITVLDSMLSATLYTPAPATPAPTAAPEQTPLATPVELPVQTPAVAEPTQTAQPEPTATEAVPTQAPATPAPTVAPTPVMTAKPAAPTPTPVPTASKAPAQTPMVTKPPEAAQKTDQYSRGGISYQITRMDQSRFDPTGRYGTVMYYDLLQFTSPAGVFDQANQLLYSDYSSYLSQINSGSFQSTVQESLTQNNPMMSDPFYYNTWETIVSYQDENYISIVSQWNLVLGDQSDYAIGNYLFSTKTGASVSLDDLIGQSEAARAEVRSAIASYISQNTALLSQNDAQYVANAYDFNAITFFIDEDGMIELLVNTGEVMPSAPEIFVIPYKSL